MTILDRRTPGRSFALAALGALAATISTGCGGAAPSPVPPDIPVLPVTFENNLATARACEFRGAVVDPWEAKALGANLVIAVVFTEATYSRNGTTSSIGGMKGKAVHCPPPVIEQLVRAARRPSKRGGA